MKKLRNAVILLVLTLILATLSPLDAGAVILDGTIWDGSVAASFDSGSGTEDDPYIIRTAPQLAYLASSVNLGNTYEGKYIRLIDNLVLNNTMGWEQWNKYMPKNGWTPIGIKNNYDYLFNNSGITKRTGELTGGFCGVFDGGGHIIRGMYVNRAEDQSGLFALNRGEIRRLGIAQSYVIGVDYTASIAAVNLGTIELCYNSGNVDSDMNVKSTYSIKDRTSSTTVENGWYVGGLCGVSHGTVNDCYNTGTVRGGFYVGGIAGQLRKAANGDEVSTLRRCYSAGSIDWLYYPHATSIELKTGETETGFFGGGVAGGVIGGNVYGHVAGCRYLEMTDNTEIEMYGNTIGTKLTAAEMLESISYGSFDFNTVWEMDPGGIYKYPTLRGVYHYSWHSHQIESEWKAAEGVADCDAPGREERRCTVCASLMETRSVAPTGHKPGSATTVRAATCTGTGLSETYCTVCGKTLESREIPAAGHTPGELTETEKPTCTGAGVGKRYCTVCGAEAESRLIEPAGHTPGGVSVINEPTCTREGLGEQCCTVCGAQLSTTVINARGHTFGEWSVIFEPTEYTTGVEQRLCTVCGARENADIPILEVSGHTIFYIIAAATAAFLLAVLIMLMIFIFVRKGRRAGKPE